MPFKRRSRLNAALPARLARRCVDTGMVVKSGPKYSSVFQIEESVVFKRVREALRQAGSLPGAAEPLLESHHAFGDHGNGGFRHFPHYRDGKSIDALEECRHRTHTTQTGSPVVSIRFLDEHRDA